MTRIIVCSFSSGLDDMPRKQQADVVAVLSSLKRSGRFSVFEATANDTIARMMTRICHKGCTIVKPDGTRREYGKLVETDHESIGFPWTKVKLTEAGEQVLSVELVGLETGQTPAIILTAPLGISLDASPTLQIDGTSFASTGWKVCVQQGCIARVEAQDLAEKLRGAAKIVVSFQGPGEPPENIAIDVPIDGLSAGIDRIVQSNQ